MDKTDIINYLVDCLGYSVQDCANKSKDNLLLLIDNLDEFQEYNAI